MACELLLRDETPDVPGRELRPDLGELRLGHLHALAPEDLAGLVEAESVPDD